MSTGLATFEELVAELDSADQQRIEALHGKDLEYVKEHAKTREALLQALMCTEAWKEALQGSDKY